MKLLIVGCGGMLGNALFSFLSRDHDTHGTCRKASQKLLALPNVKPERVFEDVDLLEWDSFENIVNELKPDVVINCVGVIKQLKKSQDAILSIEVNSLLPHKIAALCEAHKIRLIHFSTDCVFAGDRGRYTIKDNPNPVDFYGRSKLLGEVGNRKYTLTLRTSIIGLELESQVSLVNWFLNSKGEVQGFNKAIFSGFPTYTIAKIINDIILCKPHLNGLYQLSSPAISKYELLSLIKKEMNFDIIINKNDDFIMDRSLLSTEFEREFGYHSPEWIELVKDLSINKSYYLDQFS